MYDLPHIAARLYGTPLLVARAKLDVILGVLEPRLSGRMALPMPDDDGVSDSGTADVDVTADGIAIIPVMGTLPAIWARPAD
jgi:capsid assembly protease